MYNLKIPYKDFMPDPAYEQEFLPAVMKLINLTMEELKKDECWYWCFNDYLTPEEAVNEYKKHMSKNQHQYN